MSAGKSPSAARTRLEDMPSMRLAAAIRLTDWSSRRSAALLAQPRASSRSNDAENATVARPLPPVSLTGTVSVTEKSGQEVKSSPRSTPSPLLRWVAAVKRVSAATARYTSRSPGLGRRRTVSIPPESSASSERRENAGWER